MSHPEYTTTSKSQQIGNIQFTIFRYNTEKKKFNPSELVKGKGKDNQTNKQHFH